MQCEGRDTVQQGLLTADAKLLLSNDIRAGTSKIYSSRFRKFADYCSKLGYDPTCCPPEIVVNFLASLKGSGLKFSTINGYKAAIARQHRGGISSDTMVKRVTKSCFNANPPIPKYADIWDADILLSHISSLPADSELSTMDLSIKLCSLIAVLSLCRQSSLAAIGPGFQLVDDNVHLPINKLEKTSNCSNIRNELILPRGSDRLDLYSCISTYLERTKKSRDYYAAAEGQPPSSLFISTTKPYQPVNPSTLAKWLLRGMEAAGVDTTSYKAHSVRWVLG